jgi:uncharacterized protein
MHRYQFVTLLITLSASLAACASCRGTGPEEDTRPGLPKGRVIIHRTSPPEQIEFDVEVVASTRGRSRGLMFRDKVPDGQGMLFLFEKEAVHPFWMKNTLVALDIIFINEAYSIVGILHNAKPLNEESLSVGVASRYVLEVAGGSCARLGIHRGQTVTVER